MLLQSKFQIGQTVVKTWSKHGQHMSRHGHDRGCCRPSFKVSNKGQKWSKRAHSEHIARCVLACVGVHVAPRAAVCSLLVCVCVCVFVCNIHHSEHLARCISCNPASIVLAATLCVCVCVCVCLFAARVAASILLAASQAAQRALRSLLVCVCAASVTASIVLAASRCPCIPASSVLADSLCACVCLR